LKRGRQGELGGGDSPGGEVKLVWGHLALVWGEGQRMAVEAREKGRIRDSCAVFVGEARIDGLGGDVSILS